MMEVVADKTGYPTDMLELGMDMEADLGIDSIKRVEILGAVQEIITDLPELNPEDLAELRTLGEIVSYMQSKVTPTDPTPPGSAAPVPAAVAIDLGHIQNVMMEVVADKTGYPVDMLELAMDMEADLGIDSIKRVEILGAVQEIITDLPELNPEDLAELRTLGEIVSHMQQKVQSTVTGSAAPVAESVAAQFDPAPSATVAIERLSSVTKISQDAAGANALIVDDGTGAAVVLSAKLTKAGWNVTAIKPTWVKATSKKAFAKAVKVVEISDVIEDEIKAIIANGAQLDAVIYMQPATTINNIEYPQASKQGLVLAFILAKLSKVTAAAKMRGSFVVVTRQGGQLGFINNESTSADTSADLVQGGLNGLVKTLSHEWADVLCRAVDFSAKLAAEKVATLVSDELLDANTELSEVGYDQEGRLTLVGVATDSYALTAGNSIDADSVFLVSGGAKGVTAHCVIRIAQQHKSKFILLGRSVFSNDEPSWAKGINDEAVLKKAAMQALIAAGDKPTPVKVMQFIKPIFANREISDTLTAIKAAGGQAEYVASDVTDALSVQAAVNPIIAKFGQVTGIIHGAGVLADKFIEQKTLSDFEAVYSTKIDGLLSMLAVTEQSELKHLVLFSSAAGFYGNPGQSDYSIANDILNKTAYRFKALHPKTQVLSFNWGPWDGGMVTPELKRMFAARGVYIIPLDAGAQLLLSELSAVDNRCPQILVGNDLSKDADGSSVKDAEGSQKDQVASVKKPQVSRYQTGLTTAKVVKSLQATNNVFLEDHTFNGNQVLPTVCAIAWMSDAATAVYSDYQYLGFEDYQLFKGVIFDGSEANDYTIDLAPSEQSDDQGIVRVKVTIASINDVGKPVFHYGATLLIAKDGITGLPLNKSLPSIVGQVTPDAAALYDNGTLFHGESLQGISAIVSCDAQGLLLACQVPEIATVKQGDFPLSQHNIFANDLVYQAMLVWVRKQYGIASLPTSTAVWTVYREVAPSEVFYLELKVVEHNLDQRRGSKAVCDIQLIAQDMSVIAQVKSAQVRASKSLNAMFEKKVFEK